MSAGLDPAVFTRVDSSARTSLPALQAMLVLRKGRLVWEQYWGGADSSTAFNAKSVSKSLLSALVGIAISQGKLSLDQRVASLLPDNFAQSPAAPDRMFRAAVVRNDSLRATITVRHLLTQTAGSAWDEAGPILSSFLLASDPVRLVAELPMVAQPGTTFNYSTGNTHLLAAALTRAVETPLGKFANDALLGPSGIPLAGWDVDGAGHPLGGVQMYFTARALARFAASSTWIAVRSAARPGGPRGVDRRVMAETGQRDLTDLRRHGARPHRLRLPLVAEEVQRADHEQRVGLRGTVHPRGPGVGPGDRGESSSMPGIRV